MAAQQPTERPALIGWRILEGGDVLATFALVDGRRCQLLVTDQLTPADQVADMAGLAAQLAPRPGPALLNVT